MGDKTGIAWTDATWSPVTGCAQVSRGCANCYSKRMFPFAYGKDRDFNDVQCHRERLDQPVRWKKPRMVFVCSMGDLFHEDVPNTFLDCVFEMMKRAPQHIFQVLTKRPQRMAEYLALYDEGDMPHVWVGVSVEDQRSVDERIPILLQVPAAVKWVSAEPLLDRLDIYDHWHKLDWVVCGGESGARARPMVIGWARWLMEQCRYYHIPFFMKQLSQADAPKTFRDFESFPKDLQVREYPKEATE